MVRERSRCYDLNVAKQVVSDARYSIKDLGNYLAQQLGSLGSLHPEC
jgi:hypothetical protein